MKKIIALLAFIALTITANAGLQTLLGSPVTVNGTTNSSAATIAYAGVPQGTFYIYNGGLASTNALVAYRQVSIDGSNYVTIATYRPTATNTVTDTFGSDPTNMPIYSRVQIVTTNSVSVGVTIQQ